MNNQTIKFLAFIFIGILVFSGCQLSDNDKGINEGRIVYNVTYLESEETNPLISLLPNNLKMSFKENNVFMSVEGWMGIFKSGFLRDSEAGKTLTLMKVMNKKYYYENISDENFMGVTSYTNLKIEFDSLETTIIGFECKHAKVTVPMQEVVFDVYYTSGFDIDEPNQGTPFGKIPGVLLEFQLEMNGIPMHIIANELQSIKIPKKTFQIPEDYEEVDKQVVDDLIASLLE